MWKLKIDKKFKMFMSSRLNSDKDFSCMSVCVCVCRGSEEIKENWDCDWEGRASVAAAV